MMKDSEGPWLGKAADDVLEKRRAEAAALTFLQTVAANLDNAALDDASFRQFMRNSMDGMLGIDYTKGKS